MKPELDAAVRAVEAMAGRKATPTRHDARPVLLGIGAAILAGRPEVASAARERLAKLPEPLRRAWEDAVLDELAMASTEHVRSVDPRHLAHPRYDLEYTLQARRRLEARVLAAEALGLAPGAPHFEAIARADALLERARKLSLRQWLEEHRGDAIE
jgi:hypothetical protein